MVKEIAKIIKGNQPHCTPELVAQKVLEYISSSLPLRTDRPLTLEEHNQVVKGMVEQIHRECETLCDDEEYLCEGFGKSMACETDCNLYKALTLNGKPVKVKEYKEEI